MLKHSQLRLSVKRISLNGMSYDSKESHLFSMGEHAAADCIADQVPLHTEESMPVLNLSASAAQDVTFPPKSLSVECNFAKFIVTPNKEAIQRIHAFITDIGSAAFPRFIIPKREYHNLRALNNILTVSRKEQSIQRILEMRTSVSLNLHFYGFEILIPATETSSVSEGSDWPDRYLSLFIASATVKSGSFVICEDEDTEDAPTKSPPSSSPCKSPQKQGIIKSGDFNEGEEDPIVLARVSFCKDGVVCVCCCFFHVRPY